VDDVSFQIARGETLGLVGESGCGKTTTARAILRLVEPTSGEVLLRLGDPGTTQVQSVLGLGGRRLRALRRYMAMIFQDPHASLNPRLPVAATVEEGLIVHRLGNRLQRRERAGQLLERVGLDRRALAMYPHAFSGGQRQRIGIARALVTEPAFVVCDEPVSALDVSVQGQILNLLLDLQRERRLTYLFIAHDLDVVAHMSRRVAVMYKGQIVELADTAELYKHPAHPYTRRLLRAAPARAQWPAREAATLATRFRLPGSESPGQAASTGCRFQGACPEAMPECAHTDPPLIQLGNEHLVRCHLHAFSGNPVV
jgi:oligopeptide/dipeptide ABC transporter ATP-binding protein